MKFYAINGSPRKTNNTATLLQAALEGVQGAHPDQPVETELVHLRDLKFESCRSCFACKRLGGKHYGQCALTDSLTPVLEKLGQADGIIFGSPIYFGNITGLLKSFFERLLFPYFVYDAAYSSIAPRRPATAFIYTMNVTEDMAAQWGYPQLLQPMETYVGAAFSAPEILCAYNTYQFDDYTKYMAERFSEPEKAAWRAQQFPLDCQAATRLGKNMAERAAQ